MCIEKILKMKNEWCHSRMNGPNWLLFRIIIIGIAYVEMNWPFSSGSTVNATNSEIKHRVYHRTHAETSISYSYCDDRIQEYLHVHIDSSLHQFDQLDQLIYRSVWKLHTDKDVFVYLECLLSWKWIEFSSVRAWNNLSYMENSLNDDYK